MTGAAMIAIRLPAHLRALAHCDSEIRLDAEPTQRGVVDAIEREYPMLRGTIRDPATGRRRAFIRFFALEQDLSHADPDEPLPGPVAAGAEPYLVVGAMAGG